jgi:aminomethyltransferase
VNDSSENEDDALPVLTLPLDEWHRARGARMVEFAGYWMPVQYEGIIAEHQWTRTHAGLFDVSHMGQLEVSGEGSAAGIEALLPIDLATLQPGRQRYSVLLDENGGVLDDLMLVNAAHHWYLVVNGATKWDDIAHLREHLPDEITLNHLDDDALLALQGPEAAQALARLGLEAMNDGWPRTGEMKFMQAGPFRWGEVALRVSRSGYTGEDGCEISVPAADAEALAERLLEEPDVQPAGLGARDSLRLEAGLPLHGNDIDELTTPIEAGLLWTIGKRRRMAWDFPGAGAVRDEFEHGAHRRRVGIRPEGRAPARAGTLIVAPDGTGAGTVTSGGFSPTLNGPLAMGYVRKDLAADGAALSLMVRDKPLPARVVPLPFVPHRYAR